MGLRPQVVDHGQPLLYTTNTPDETVVGSLPVLKSNRVFATNYRLVFTVV